MGERKVLNKYYPSDFDPAKITRRRQPKNLKLRTMLPMTVRCGTCRNCAYKGTKFNSPKEAVAGETYLGIQIYRFYYKCANCSAVITLKTDPRNSDYVVESGASRNLEPWHAEEEERERRNTGERGDAMRYLESRSAEAKRGMEKLAALEELKSMNLRRANVTADALLESLQRSYERKELEEEDGLCRPWKRGKVADGDPSEKKRTF